MALEVKEGDLVSDRRHNSIPVRGEDEVPGAIHRPVQVRELERKLHSCSENRYHFSLRTKNTRVKRTETTQKSSKSYLLACDEGSNIE